MIFAKKKPRGNDVEIQELIVDAHNNVYYLIKVTLELAMTRIYISLMILSIFYKFYWQSLGEPTLSKKLESTTPLHEKNTKNVDSAIIEMTAPADVEVHMRALAARDKMTEDTRRQTVMPPEMNEASTTQDIEERQKLCNAGKDV